MVLPDIAGHDVARLGGAAARHVLAGRHDADHVERQLQSSRSRVKAPNTAAAPHMSNFISSMPGGGLSEMPPVSKVMPLPTRHRRRFAALAAAILEHDHVRRLLGAVGDRQEDPIFSRRHSASFSTLTRILVPRAQRRAAPARDSLACRHWRAVGEIAHQAHAGKDALAVLDAALGIAAIAASGDRDAELRQRRLLALVRRLVVGDAVLRVRRDLDRDARHRVRVGIADAVEAEIADGILRAGRATTPSALASALRYCLRLKVLRPPRPTTTTRSTGAPAQFGEQHDVTGSCRAGRRA